MSTVYILNQEVQEVGSVLIQLVVFSLYLLNYYVS